MFLRHVLILLLAIAPVAVSGCTLWNKTGGSELAITRSNRPEGGDSYDRYSVEDAIAERELEKEQPLTTDDLAPEKTIQRISGTFDTLRGKGWNPRAAKQAFVSGDEIYRLARESRSKDQFLQAADFYATAAKRWPKSALEEDALFKSGECYFFADHYDDANDQYERLVREHPNTRHLDIAESRRFLIAKFWLDTAEQKPDVPMMLNFFNEARPLRDTDGHAVRVFDAIRIDDPTGKLADDATIAAANAIMKSGDFDRADDYFTDLRETFPTSEHQFSAHLLGIQAKLKRYDGPDYDGSPLEEALKLIRQTRIQFREESAKNKDYLDRAEATVNRLLAERDWELGTYYDRRGEYAGARYHYQKIIENYPKTELAVQAQERNSALTGRPNAPLDKAEWLTRWLPKSDDEELGSITPDGVMR